ncbi:hypothetical protein N7509_008078 [Penicillium cosmopolitanum]|uniref:Transcription factor domain-containing protein n=1 Tax=Penicillium cosmopolitanum TaxID=1131564 RepID=A0A9X0B930_9EURO|nr:uncharacterized protein N7509_008078 [Penicillium cosmopolitanum]KAJ5392588.1 hypothetical protein N7509_008078 [Penicillium cosmopolitanum]
MEYQSLAIKHLHADLSRTSCWDEELIFVIFMLGLSTSWHVVTDLGIVHLKAIQQAIHEPNFRRKCDSQILKFFKEALVYWEMVISSVHDDVVVHNDLIANTTPVLGPLHDSHMFLPGSTPQIMPHPWTGIAAGPQILFARAVHCIRQARSFDPVGSRPESIGNPLDRFLGTLNELESDIWKMRLPALHEIASTGDRNTPAIHHLLVAEAYMYATMYQLYYIFRNLRLRRFTLMGGILGNESLLQDSWALYQEKSWNCLSQTPCGSERWVKLLGRNVILRLEQIQDTSGTCCVHPLLLLVGSTSLSVIPELEESLEVREVFRVRRFVLDRVSQVSASKLSEPVFQVHSVILEIFRRLDLGLEVFWMDILNALDFVTIIG